MTNPEPLNLDIQLKANLTYKWGNEYDFINFKKGYEKGFSEAQKVILKMVKQRIRLACEFYLKYFNKPIDLKYDFLELAEEIDEMVEADLEHLDAYNLWLFKLAFKDVLDGGEKE